MIAFTSVIEIRGVNPFIPVDADLATRIKKGWRRPCPVLVRINGQPKTPWRINMMPAGEGRFYLYLHEAVRKASGTKVGDRVTVEVAFDDGYRSGPAHPMPRSFRSALSENLKAKKSWEALVPSRKKEILRYFAGLKSAEARDRNFHKALDVLSGKEGRFMARAWKDGK